MKRFILTTIFILCFILTHAQVHVRGYYRKDGTYVRPHVRSNPDGNPSNNWSYPGNTNPYTWKTATGNPDTYLKNYNNQNSSSSGEASSSERYNPSTYYVTANSLNVRSGPSTKHSVIKSLSYSDGVYVVNNLDNGWKEISYLDISDLSLRLRTGYIYGEYLSTSNPALTNDYKINNYTSSTLLDESQFNEPYKFKTTFNNSVVELPLRVEPNVNSREIYKCPKNSIIYVIDNSGEVYFKVYVNGYTGYLSKGYLKRQW